MLAQKFCYFFVVINFFLISPGTSADTHDSFEARSQGVGAFGSFMGDSRYVSEEAGGHGSDLLNTIGLDRGPRQPVHPDPVLRRPGIYPG